MLRNIFLNIFICLSLLTIGCRSVLVHSEIGIDGSQQIPSSAKVKAANPVSYGFDLVREGASTSTYVTKGLCNGLPRVQQVKTAPGFCLGLVDNGEGLIKPRYALQIAADKLLVTDMGGWKPNNGQVYLLQKQGSQWKRTSLLNSKNLTGDKNCILDRTHQLVRGPENLIYITSVRCVAVLDTKQIVKLDTKQIVQPNPQTKDAVSSLRILINNLPSDGLHAVKAVVFDGQGNLLMNVGSITDNCELETTEKCQELFGADASGLQGDSPAGLQGRALIRKYKRLTALNEFPQYDPNFSIFSRGQRNSLALHWDEKNQTLWTGENSRDYIERKDTKLNGQEKPSDEFNIIREGSDLDWPYCYDSGLVSPEFPHANCKQYQQPHLLFPAHAAPLGFLYYTGKLFPPWYQNRLLVSFHGYAPYGHRIVTYKRNDQSLPVGDPLSVVYGWDTQGNQKTGSPVGITQGLDGSVFITEDNSQKILQLYYNAQEGNGQPVAELKLGTAQVDNTKIAAGFLKAEEQRKEVFQKKMQNPDKAPLFSQIQSRLIDKHCVQCHGGMSYPGVQLLKYDDVGNYKKIKDQLWVRLNGQGVAQMPVGGLPPAEKDLLLQLVQKWMQAGEPEPK